MTLTSKSRRVAVATALCTIAAVGAGAATAPARDMPFDSKIRLTDRFPFAHGKVKSDSDDCIANRKIRLFEEKKGEDLVLGKTRTGSDGKWTLEMDTYSGVFYAKVNQYANESTGLVCLPAKSKKVVID